jgi:hypothetical protein
MTTGHVATAHQLMALGRWKGLDQVETYTAKARDGLLADQGQQLIRGR